MKVRNVFALMMVLLLLSLTACGGNSGTEAMDYAVEQEMPAVESGTLTDSNSTSSSALPENRKLIRTVRMDAETDDLDLLIGKLESKIAELGGYVENREIYNGSTYASHRYRYGNLTIRIPAENLDGFVEHVEGASNVVSCNESVDDVTLQYVDTESRVQALEVEQERLMALLEKAETMADLLEIESRLTEVRYELESVASQLKTLENQVSYSTVYLYITEVQEYTPVEEETVWERISGGFMDSIEGITDGAVELIVWVLGNSPYLVLFGGIAVVVVILLRKRKRKVKKAPREDEKAE